MKIAIYAIAKNEAAHVQRFMTAAAAADWVIVADTGSSDDTIEQLRAAGASVHSVAISPWRFDQARNTALSLVPTECDICIALDLDEVLPAGWRVALEAAWQPGVTRLRYRFAWSHTTAGDPAMVYWADKIHARHGYHWQHPVHELLVSDSAEVCATADLQIDHYPDHTKPRSSYLALLEVAVAERPESAQHAFWLGREYLLHRQWAAAMNECERYLNLPAATWPVERAAAMRCMARANAELGNPVATERWLVQACAEASGEREPWVDLAHAYYVAGKWAEGYAAAQQALSITKRPQHYLAEEYAWGERADDLAAICAWNLGLHDAARWHIVRAASSAPSDQRIAANVHAMQATPRISAALIVKNEAALLARCLESIRDSVDEIIIVDTGSQDGTQAIARRYTNRVFDFAWQNDFAAARQYAFDQASGDWVFWIDADDVLLHADQIRTSVQNAGAGVHCLWWKYVYSSDSYGNPTCEFWRERCVRHDQSFRWVGRVHEYLSNPQPHQSLHDPAVVVLHQRPAERNAGNLRRNLALLLEEYTQAPEQATTRQLLYLGNEYASLGDAKQAIGYFERYLRVSTWADEKYLVQVQIAALQRQSEHYEQAIDSDLQALKICPHWPDAYYGLARSYYALRDWHRVIHWSEVGRAMPQPQTSQIINPMEYRYGWIIYYTNALYQIGEIGEAQQWTRYALGICPEDPQHQHNLRFFEQALAPQQPWIEMHSMPRGAENTITV